MDLEKYSFQCYDNVLVYPGKSDGSKCESDVELTLVATERGPFFTYESMSERILTEKIQFRLGSIPITDTFDEEAKAKLNVVL